MHKFVNIFIFIALPIFLYGQESLMLGEYRIEEITPAKDTNNAERVTIYAGKYKKGGKLKNVVEKGYMDYSASGFLLQKMFYGGKKNQNKYVKKYTYDTYGNLVEYDNISISNGTISNNKASFSYNIDGQVIMQEISLAIIRYDYHDDGRMKSKSYYYNNRGETSTEPWTIYFEYDENLNLIHADVDTTGDTQTSFYNEKNQLIKHDYYPGVAYSTYEYDTLGNCIKQTDYELGKKDWDSTVYLFEYDAHKRLIKSASSNKRGKIRTDQEWIYNSKNQLSQEIIYVKGKKKWVYKYKYEYYPFKE